VPVPSRLLALPLLALALAACGGGGEDASHEFQDEGAPFAFTYPSAFTRQLADTGSEIRDRPPRFKVAVGTDEVNVVVVAAYNLARPAESYAPADFAMVVDRAAAALARASGATIAGRERGKLGDLDSTVYRLSTSSEGRDAQLVFAFRGRSQYFVRCQWDAAGRESVATGCSEVQRSFRRA
jgi:hypothetical protein